MILTALTLAATLTGAAPAPPAGFVHPPPMAERTPNLYRPPGPGCADVERRVSEDQQEHFRKLGRLPRGYAEYAVMRQLDGCPVAAPMGYHPPALPGAADAPAMREAAPPARH